MTTKDEALNALETDRKRHARLCSVRRRRIAGSQAEAEGGRVNDLKAPTLDQLAYLKLRLRTLPDELNMAREALSRLAAEVRDQKTTVAEQEAEIAAMTRAEWLALAKDKKPAEAAVAAAVKVAIEKDEPLRSQRRHLRDVELRKEGAELTVKHLADRFTALQFYADLTAAEVRLLVGGLGA